MNKKIKAICIKDLQIDGIKVCRKGDMVEMEESEHSYRQHWHVRPPACYDDCLLEHALDYCTVKKYQLKKNWLSVCFLGTRQAAQHLNGIDFNEYFIIANMELTAENVEKIYKECHCAETKGVIAVEGILTTDTYNKAKLEKHKADIKGMLEQLPMNFKKEIGGGWSFLQMCMRNDDVQWTGLHRTMEKLMTMAIALKLMEYLLPKQMWSILPAGMPYIAIL